MLRRDQKMMLANTNLDEMLKDPYCFNRIHVRRYLVRFFKLPKDSHRSLMWKLACASLACMKDGRRVSQLFKVAEPDLVRTLVSRVWKLAERRFGRKAGFATSQSGEAGFGGNLGLAGLGTCGTEVGSEGRFRREEKRREESLINPSHGARKRRSTDASRRS